MSALKNRIARRVGITLLAVLAGTAGLGAQERFQIELYGGFSFLNPKDLNLLATAEELYNKYLFIERLAGHLGYLGQNDYAGYFLNEFPRITNALPAGLRFKCLISPALSLSISVEGFQRRQEISMSGTITVQPGSTLSETKAYDPFRVDLNGLSVLGGLHYGFSVGRSTEIEAGLAAGWTWAGFDILSDSTFSVDLRDENGETIHSSINGHRLEGDGRGNGFAAKTMVRLNRAMGRRWGFFVETAMSYSRIKSLRGSGRESQMSLPGATTWEGDWGIKRENIVGSSGSSTYADLSISVPTNYWEGWVAGQRERDFILDLSALSFGMGIYFKF
jgi:hypothetical protein